MSLVFFSDGSGQNIHWVNHAMNVVDASRFFEGNPNFVCAIPEQKKPIRLGISQAVQVQSAHTDTPVLWHTPLSQSGDDRVNRCFHPFSYIRCNKNTAAVPVLIPVTVLGRLTDVEVIVKFPVNRKIAEMVAEPACITFVQRDRTVVLQIGSAIEIVCEVEFPSLITA